MEPAKFLVDSAPATLLGTALNGVHRALGAKMVNFGGWDVPVGYPSTGGQVAEHTAVRGSVGVFDVSHMDDIRIHGRCDFFIEAMRAIAEEVAENPDVVKR
jgi:glycine cleavage system aminomethyltransferase T